MPDQSLFHQVMDSGLRDWFSRQSQARAAALAKRTQRIVMAVIAAIVVGLALSSFAMQIEFALFAAAAIVFGGLAWAESATKALKDDIKTAANREIAHALDLSYTLSIGPSADFALATDMGLLPANPDEQTHTDAWSGVLDGVDLHIHEAHLQEWVQRGKHRSLETIFHGVVLGYQFSRPFTSTTIVKRDAGIFNAFGALGAQLGKSRGGTSLERVRLVDPRFEKAFEVYGSDQVEARYLVHPAFCERLLEMEAAFQGKNLRMVFARGRVVVVIETGDLFETGGMDAARDEERVAKTCQQIQSLLELSKALNERARVVQS
jgi:Protein of unknown function (DUF3137)